MRNGLTALALAGLIGFGSGLLTGASVAQAQQGAAPAVNVAAAPAPAAAAPRAAYAAHPRAYTARRYPYQGRRYGYAGRPMLATRGGGQYFVEFRARYALSYGHTYAAFGRLNANGQIGPYEVAGLHPAGESSVPWMVGHLLPVPAETGPSDGDLDEQYVAARYRVTMNEAEYNKVVAKIREMQRSTPLWSATVYNCNSFVADIARYMGLKAGISTLMVPPSYIASLKQINNGQATVAPGAI